MRQQESPRVLGPYVSQKGGKTSYRIIEASSGHRRAHTFLTMAEARKAMNRLAKNLALQEAKNLAMRIDEYYEYLVTDRGCAAVSSGQRCDRVRGFFPSLKITLPSVTARQAEELYRWHTTRINKRTGRPYSAATHQSDLYTVRAFMGWAMSRQYLASNPFSEVKNIGQKKAGKPQLRIDEAKRWIDTALEMVKEGNSTALAALLCLWCGFRASEVMHRVVRDIDQGGATIWIDRGKTKSSRRRPKVPEFLRPYLLALCEGKAPTQLIFGSKKTGPQPHGCSYLHHWVHAICRRAKVPTVCTHSLRGLHATLSLTGGASSDYVATALGHTSFGMTERHYVNPESLANQRATQVHDTLGINQRSSPAEELLRSLDHSTLADLRRLLTEKADESGPKPTPPIIPQSFPQTK